jgi:hypothetical protein
VDPLLLTLQVLLSALGVLGVAAAAPEAALEQALRAARRRRARAARGPRPEPRGRQLAPLAYVVTLALLVLVLAAGVSPEGLQARRWLAARPGDAASPPS